MNSGSPRVPRLNAGNRVRLLVAICYLSEPLVHALAGIKRCHHSNESAVYL
jgi:hypothetical protein